MIVPTASSPISHGAMLLASHASMGFVILYSCFGLDSCCFVYFDVGSVMDASKRMMLAKAMKEARAVKAGASSAPAADLIPPPTLPSPPPITTEAPLGSTPSSPHSPEALQTPGSPLPIAAVPLAVVSSPAPTPLDKGKRVLEILSDDEDSDGGLVFKRRRAARVPHTTGGFTPGRELP